MNREEFAFFNEQLAAMLRSGIPLEGALKRLAAEMRRGKLRDEMQKLEADLATGRPLGEAIAACKLPELYVRMVQAGVKANDLPGTLTLLADHYQATWTTWTRLKGLLVYPAIVLVTALVISGVLTMMVTGFASSFFGETLWNDSDNISRQTLAALIGAWLPPVFLSFVTLFFFGALLWPRSRGALRWKIPGFREASLARTASMLALMIRKGSPLDEAFALAAAGESGTLAAGEIRAWQERVKAGVGRFPDLAVNSVVFPQLFLWLVGSGETDLAAGFARAAEFYRARAASRIDVMLYAVLPVSAVALGLMILGQLYPVLRVMSSFLQSLSAFE